MKFFSNHKGFATLLFVLIVLIISCIMYTISIRLKTNIQVNQYYQEVYVMQKLELLAIELVRTSYQFPFYKAIGDDFIQIDEFDEYYIIQLNIKNRKLTSKMYIDETKIIYEYIDIYPLLE